MQQTAIYLRKLRHIYNTQLLIRKYELSLGKTHISPFSNFIEVLELKMYITLLTLPLSVHQGCFIAHKDEQT